MNKHLAFEEREDDDNVLWVHHAREGHWWTVELVTGAHNEAEPVAFTTTGNEGDTHGYSDLAVNSSAKETKSMTSATSVMITNRRAFD